MLTFELIPSPRIARTVVALEWEDLSRIGTGVPYLGGQVHRTTVTEGLEHIARQAVGVWRYDPKLHRLQSVIWDDGGRSAAFPRWSDTRYPEALLYLNSAGGSSMLTARYRPADARAAA